MNTFFNGKEVYVKEYLTYDQIQRIAEEVVKLSSWAERQQMIDFMTLCYVLDVDREEIYKVRHDGLLTSGLLEFIKTAVKNYYQIKDAVDYEDSFNKQLNRLMEQLPQVAKDAIAKAQIKKEDK